MKRHLIILSTPTDFDIKAHLPPRQIIYTDPVEVDTDVMGGQADLAALAVKLCEVFFIDANFDWLTKEGMTSVLANSRGVRDAMTEEGKAALQRDVDNIRKLTERGFIG